MISFNFEVTLLLFWLIFLFLFFKTSFTENIAIDPYNPVVNNIKKITLGSIIYNKI